MGEFSLALFSSRKRNFECFWIRKHLQKVDRYHIEPYGLGMGWHLSSCVNQSRLCWEIYCKCSWRMKLIAILLVVPGCSALLATQVRGLQGELDRERSEARRKEADLQEALR